MKVAIIIGTRPEAIKLAPLVRKMKADPFFEVQVVDTGQHREMAQQVYDMFTIEPDIRLNVMVAGQTLSVLSANLHAKMGDFFKTSLPRFVIVQGDTTTAMIGAVEGFYHQVTVCHVEAGLRTGNIYSPFPEEMNRLIIGEIATYHFAPTTVSAANLKKEGKKNIHQVGNTVVDALQLLRPELEHRSATFLKEIGFDIPHKKTILITAHRRESFSGGLSQIFNAVKFLAEKYPDLLFVFPVHLNPNVRETAKNLLGDISNVRLIPPVNYPQLLFLLQRSLVVLTDSGGIQEEAPSFSVPVLVLRETTERPEGVDAGCAILCGTDQDIIQQTFTRLMEDQAFYAGMSSGRNPYGDGMASDRIIGILKKGTLAEE